MMHRAMQTFPSPKVKRARFTIQSTS
jgi:hypothetical protein